MGIEMRIHLRPNRLPIIETKRLVLRDITVEDISPSYIEWLNDPETVKYLEVRFSPQTPEKVRAYVEKKLNDIENSQHFGVYDNNGCRLVGTVTLPQINRNHAFADISFVIGHPGTQGKGYATEAVHAVCYYAFFYLRLNKLWGGYYDGHIASAKVFEKNGFNIEGCIRKKLICHEGKRVDHVLVGLLSQDYQPNDTLLGTIPRNSV